MHHNADPTSLQATASSRQRHRPCSAVVRRPWKSISGQLLLLSNILIIPGHGPRPRLRLMSSRFLPISLKLLCSLRGRSGEPERTQQVRAAEPAPAQPFTRAFTGTTTHAHSSSNADRAASASSGSGSSSDLASGTRSTLGFCKRVVVWG